MAIRTLLTQDELLGSQPCNVIACLTQRCLELSAQKTAAGSLRERQKEGRKQKQKSGEHEERDMCIDLQAV